MEVQVIHHEIPGPIGNPIPMHISRQKLSGGGKCPRDCWVFPPVIPRGDDRGKMPYSQNLAGFGSLRDRRICMARFYDALAR